MGVRHIRRHRARRRVHPTPTPPHQGEGGGAEGARTVAAWVFDQILVMLHPFMPFITEEFWNAMGERTDPLILAKWPMPDARRSIRKPARRSIG